ncbi:MAG: hypothetical protein V1659_04915 [Candidatus Woesearchaeota archaeon]
MASDIVLIIVSTVTILNSALILLLYRHLKKVLKDLNFKLNDINLDTKIADVFSGSQEEDKSLHDLANDLFEHVKIKYKIKAHSYSDVITKLGKMSDIDDNLRDSLIDFFEHMIVISYKKEGPHFEHEKEYLKSKLKSIVRVLQDDK